MPMVEDGKIVDVGYSGGAAVMSCTQALKLPFELGITQYDDPPPDEIGEGDVVFE